MKRSSPPTKAASAFMGRIKAMRCICCELLGREQSSITDVHHIRELIDEHPHTVHIRAEQPRALAREFLTAADVLSLRFEEGAVIVQTGKPDVFYARLTDMATSNACGAIHEVTSPDDTLAAVFQYLVKP